MKLFRGLLLIVFVVFGAMEAQSQVYSDIAVGLDRALIRVKDGGIDPNIIGSPMLTKDWVSGTVYFDGADPSASDKLNYDVMAGVLVMKKGNEEYLFSEPVKEFVLKFSTGDRTFRKVGDGFYEVVYDGKTKLLRKHVKTVMESTAYGSATVNKKIESEIQLYIGGSGNAPERVRSEKTLLSTLGNRETELKAYLKANKFSFKAEDDVVKLLKYYDSL